MAAGGDVVGRGVGWVDAVVVGAVVVGPVVAARAVAVADGAGAATGEDGAAAGPGTALEPQPAANRTSPAASERRRRGTARTRTACQFTQRRTRRIGSWRISSRAQETHVRPGGQPNMQQLMKQAQKMQQELLAAQEELANTEVTGSAGGGLVTATVTGSSELKSVVIDPSVVDPEDVETLQDLVVAAIRDANRAAQELAGQRMGPLTQGMGGLGLPGL